MLLRNMMILLVMMVAGTVHASQGDKRLDGLFVQLRTSPNAGEAKLVENRIETIWGYNEQTEINHLMHQGIVAIRWHNFPVAHQIFDRVVQQAPHFAEAWNMRAITEYVMGNYQAALQDTLQTLALEPRHFRALFRLGSIFVKMGRHEEALEAYRTVMVIHPHLEGLDAKFARVKKAVNASRI